MKAILCGYGYWGKIIERYIEQSEEFDLVGICDTMLEDSISIDKAIAERDIEAAFVCTPITTHYSLVKKLLESGKHVFCEKPLCKQIEDTVELIELAKNNNRILHTDYIYTDSPSIKYLKKHLSDLGCIKYVRMCIRQFGNFYKNDDVIDVLGVHMLSVLAFWFPNEIMFIDSVEVISKNNEGVIEYAKIGIHVGEVRIDIECSLISDTKERSIELLCEQGMMEFNMLDEDTVKIIKVDSNGYNKTSSVMHKEHFDERNNLAAAIECYALEIAGNKTDNIRIANNVAQEIDDIRKKINEKTY